MSDVPIIEMNSSGLIISELSSVIHLSMDVRGFCLLHVLQPLEKRSRLTLHLIGLKTPQITTGIIT